MGEDTGQLITILAMAESSVPVVALWGELITDFDEIDMVRYATEVETECFDAISDEFGDVVSATISAYVALFQMGCTSQKVQVLCMN